MTLPTFDGARDEILGLFNTKWTTDTPALNGGAPIRVEWPGVDAGDPPPADKPYARITLRHTTSRQATFGPTGGRRFTRPGLITVQVFTPLSGGQGLSLAEKCAIIARDAFEGRGTASGIWFRNARIQEIGPDGTWYQMNVLVEFVYDELR